MKLVDGDSGLSVAYNEKLTVLGYKNVSRLQIAMKDTNGVPIRDERHQ